MKNLQIKFIILFFFCLNNLSGQEICNNGIDDNGDGIIDINDTTACHCNGIGGGVVSIPSLIPNASFETMNCCPSSFSQMNCATDWIQASGATSDYLNTCGYVGGAVSAAGLLPFPNGVGVVGAIFIPNWQEYVGSCLLSPMLAGQSYTIQMNISSTPVSGSGGVCNGGTIYYGPIDIVIYGSTTCTNLPFTGTDCPPAPAWQVLGTANYTPVPAWGIITITFTPTVDINAIIIGSPCTLPPDYVTGPPGQTCNPYFYFDNLLLNTSSSFTPLAIVQNGSTCTNDIVLNSHTDTTGGTWQWYKDGIALVGQTDTLLDVSANGFGSGVFTAVYNIGPDCQMISDSVTSFTPAVTVTSHTDVTCSGGNDGSAIASATFNGSGTVGYAWNTVPPQMTDTAVNLTAGLYTVTASYSSGCVVTDTVTISAGPAFSINNPQVICAGQTYTINSHSYDSTGIYYDTLSTITGCDSVVVTNLTANTIYNLVNPQTICTGQSYTINGHTYSTGGTYFDTFTTSSGCDSVIETQLTEHPVFAVDNPQTICNGESYTINSHTYSSPGVFIDNYTTVSGCDSVITTTITMNPIYNIDNPQTLCDGEVYTFNNHNYSAVGNYYDTLSTVSGCDSVINTAIFVNPLPQLVFTHPDDLCIDAPEINLNYVTPAGGVYSGPGVSNNVFNPRDASEGLHSLSYHYIDPVSNCASTAYEAITVHPLPEVDFVINPKKTTIENAAISFIDNTTGSVNSIWNFGDDSVSYRNHGVHTYSDTGYFQISLFVIDNFGCRNKALDHIYIGPELSFFVPNAFTPNEDGKNETFNGTGIGITNYRMTIYDRWGNDIFHTNDLYKPWSGKDIPEGVYVYKINLNDAIGNAHEYVGHVSLVR